MRRAIVLAFVLGLAAPAAAQEWRNQPGIDLGDLIDQGGRIIPRMPCRGPADGAPRSSVSKCQAHRVLFGGASRFRNAVPWLLSFISVMGLDDPAAPCLTRS